MEYAPVLTVLGYVVRGDDVLLCHRNGRPEDPQLGKWNGVGGKVERDEDAAAAMSRELAEETGLVARSMSLRGTISWPGFGKNGEDVFGLVFLITDVEGEPPTRNVEGDLAWIPRSQIMSLPMWDGDRHFLPLVFDSDPRPFHMVIPYANGQSTGMRVTRL